VHFCTGPRGDRESTHRARGSTMPREEKRC